MTDLTDDTPSSSPPTPPPDRHPGLTHNPYYLSSDDLDDKEHLMDIDFTADKATKRKRAPPPTTSYRFHSRIKDEDEPDVDTVAPGASVASPHPRRRVLPPPATPPSPSHTTDSGLVKPQLLDNYPLSALPSRAPQAPTSHLTPARERLRDYFKDHPP